MNNMVRLVLNNQVAARVAVLDMHVRFICRGTAYSLPRCDGKGADGRNAGDDKLNLSA